MKMKNLSFQMKANQDKDFDELYILEDIGESEVFKEYGAGRLVEELAKCTKENLTVHINSSGGDVFSGVAILNTLKSSGKNVTVIVDGIAASAASLIAMAGNTIKMHKSSMLMIHNCWTIAMGNAKALRETADKMDKIMDSQKDVYVERSGGKLTREKLTELLDAETYLSAKEAKAYGLCDEIIGETEEETDTVQETEQEEIKMQEEPVIQDDPAPNLEVPKTENLWDFF